MRSGLFGGWERETQIFIASNKQNPALRPSIDQKGNFRSGRSSMNTFSASFLATDRNNPRGREGESQSLVGGRGGGQSHEEKEEEEALVEVMEGLFLDANLYADFYLIYVSFCPAIYHNVQAKHTHAHTQMCIHLYT